VAITRSTTISCGLAALLLLSFSLQSAGCAHRAAVGRGVRHPSAKAQPAPILPVEVGWSAALSALPSAGGALDDRRVYVPLQNGEVRAFDRETGKEIWVRPIQTPLPPVVRDGIVYLAASDRLIALDGSTGADRWLTELGTVPTATLTWTGAGLIAVEPMGVALIRASDGVILWRQSLGGSSRHPAAADGEAAYVALEDGTVVALSLPDGAVRWMQRLPGTLSAPASAPGRILVGSTDNFLYALESHTGELVWKWRSGGDVIGAVADAADGVYFASLDNILRAVNRSNGNQRWKKEVVSRPSVPPSTFGGAVVMTGVAPLVTAFDASNGNVLGSYTAPSELQGPPLIDPQLKPYRVAVIVITRAGRIVGLRPTAMLFTEPPVAPFLALPGRRLSRERLD
jgi:outer membrane protein assembly factor BamB